MQIVSRSQEEWVPLSSLEQERLYHILETAHGVRRRSQFYLWAQGALQGLIPHEILICAYGDLERRSLAFFRSSSVPLSEDAVADLEDLESGIVLQAIRAWAEKGGKPLLIGPGMEGGSSTYRYFEAALNRHGLANLAVHGTPRVPGYPASFFVFGRMDGIVTSRLSYLLDLLLPQLHIAQLRIATEDVEGNCAPAAKDRGVTTRELEILQWVREGKSNADIAAILAISPLTVKNHVQKILRKLNVQNRAQAVARAISLRLIDSEALRTE